MIRIRKGGRWHGMCKGCSVMSCGRIVGRFGNQHEGKPLRRRGNQGREIIVDVDNRGVVQYTHRQKVSEESVMAKLVVTMMDGREMEFEGAESEMKVKGVELLEQDEEREIEMTMLVTDEGQELFLVDDYVPYWE